MYYIYRNGKLVGSSSDIEYVVEFTKLMVDKAISTEKDSRKLKQLYEDKLTVNSPKVGINQLQPILARLEYSLEVDI